MAKQGILGAELDMVKKAFSDIFSGRVLAWQLGGTMLAALCLSIATWLSKGAIGGEGGALVAFLLAAFGFVVVYVILCLTGCIVARSLQGATEGKDEADAVAPLHFLIDNIGSAALLPLIFSGAAVVVAAVLSALCALWYSGYWQAILAPLSPVFFILALLTICDLFVLLFVVPSMVVTEQPPFNYAIRRIWRLFWNRKMALTRLFGVGLAGAVLVVAPVLVAVLVTLGLCEHIYFLAGGHAPTKFAAFMLQLYSSVLLWAPIWAVALAFLNALSYNAYGELVEGLDEEAEPDEDAEENGSAPSGGEEADLEVEGDKETKDTND